MLDEALVLPEAATVPFSWDGAADGGSCDRLGVLHGVRPELKCASYFTLSSPINKRTGFDRLTSQFPLQQSPKERRVQACSPRSRRPVQGGGDRQTKDDYIW